MVNDAFARMRGVRKGELLGQNAKCFNPPSRICDVLRTKKTFRGISHRDSGVVYYVVWPERITFGGDYAGTKLC
jgi:hypothetical protein